MFETIPFYMPSSDERSIKKYKRQKKILKRSAVMTDTSTHGTRFWYYQNDFDCGGVCLWKSTVVVCSIQESRIPNSS